MQPLTKVIDGESLEDTEFPPHEELSIVVGHNANSWSTEGHEQVGEGQTQNEDVCG